MIKVLFVGDIVGNPGRKMLKEFLKKIKIERDIEFCIANGENSAGGKGITYSIAQELYKMGVDCITLGNHTWAKSDISDFIGQDDKMIRPANYPEELPGKGSTIIESSRGNKIGIVNVLGRIYMDGIDCPFKAVEREIQEIKQCVKVVIVDIHAEATSEKCAIAWNFDGRVSAVLGTHTHVQTADERILPCGTAFLTDVGMTGPYEGIIGVDKDIILRKFTRYMPVRFEVSRGITQINAAYLEIDEKTGRTLKIERINFSAQV